MRAGLLVLALALRVGGCEGDGAPTAPPPSDGHPAPDGGPRDAGSADDGPPAPLPDALTQIPGTILFGGAIMDVVPFKLTVGLTPGDTTTTTLTFDGDPLQPAYSFVKGDLTFAGAPEARTYKSGEILPATMRVVLSQNAQTWQADVKKPPAVPIGAMGPLTLTSVELVDDPSGGPSFYMLHGEIQASLAPTGDGTANFVSARILF